MKLKLWWKWRRHPQRGVAPLSFAVPVAYDYKYLPPVIKSFYGIADEIILGLDKDRISWSGHPFEFDAREFKSMIRGLDPEEKIRVIEGDFHSGPNPMANDTEERNQLALACGKGNWIIQIDSDEVLLNPWEFKEWMDSGKGSGLIMAHSVLVFKKCGDELLVVDKENHQHAVGTRLPGGYIGARYTGQNKKLSPLRILHFSYGRTPEEMRMKLTNWGHSRDFDTDQYFEFWKSVNLDNYSRLKDVHPIADWDWPRLRKIKDPGIYQNEAPRKEVLNEPRR